MADTTLVLETLVKGTEEVRKSIGTITSGVDNLSTTIKNNAKGFRNLGIAAGLVFTGIIVGMNKTIDVATKQQNAFTGLKSIVDATGNDFNKSEKFLKEFVADGLVPVGDAATSLKNLLLRGFSLDQATVLMDRFKNSAAFGRQASLNMGEAIRGATEGLKNMNPILVDNAGVTKNMSLMYDDYAKSLGKSSAKLTEEEKIMAEYLGIIEETNPMVGDAAKMSDSFAGAMARATKAQTDLSVAVGTSMQPIKQAFYEAMTPILIGLTQFVQNHPEFVASVVAIVGAITGLIASLVTIGFIIPKIIAAGKALIAGWGLLTTAWGYLTTVAVPALITALGAISAPVWIVIGVIAALIAIGVALYKNWDTVKVFLGNTWEELKIMFSVSLQFISELWTSVWGTISSFFSELWAGIVAKLSSAWQSIKTGISNGMTWIASAFNTLATPIRAAWDVLWNSLGASAASTWDVVKGAVVSSINWIIDKINTVIKAANKLAQSGAGAIGIKIPTMPTIPKLADGGIVKARPGGILANIGEGGQDEAVIPLNKMKNMGMGGGVTINITGTFGKGAAEEIGDYIFTKLARSTYI